MTPLNPHHQPPDDFLGPTLYSIAQEELARVRLAIGLLSSEMSVQDDYSEAVTACKPSHFYVSRSTAEHVASTLGRLEAQFRRVAEQVRSHDPSEN